MRQLLLVSLALVTSVYAGSLAARQKRWIMNGVQSKEGAWPFMVSLWDGKSFDWCGGSLISKNLVLTAQHCARYDGFVIVSDYNTSKEESNDHKSQILNKTIYFPDYDEHKEYPFMDNDAAVLVMETPVKDCDIHKTILLPFKNPRNLSILAETHEAIDTSEADRCIVMGWGLYIPGVSGKHADVLRQTNFSRIVSYDECKDMEPYNFSKKLPKGDICLGDNVTHHDGCIGDSGGPAVCQSPGTNTWYQSGIVSWGRKDHCKIGKSSFGVYVSVHYHLNTILRLIKEKDMALYADFWNSMQECHGDEVSIYECTLPPSHADRKKIEQMGIRCL